MISREIKTSETNNNIILIELCRVYAMERVFEVFTILSGADRMAVDYLDWWLVGFRLLKYF